MEGLGIAKRNLVSQIVADNWKVLPESKTFTYKELLFVIQEMLDQEGTKYMQEQSVHGGPYAVFRRFVELLLYRNMANYDSMILLTATKGGGKSSAAIMIAQAWCKLLGIKFSPERHIAYNNADVMNKVDTLNPFEVVIADESVRFVSSEDWNKCISGDTIIKLPNFREMMIKDLVGCKNFRIISYNEKTQIEEVQIAEKCVYVKDDYVYEVIMESGESIKTTKEHKFLTSNGWKELQELKEGDEIIGI